MNTLLTPAFVQVTASSWGEAKELGQRLLQTYVFRGMRSSEWPLRTSLERAATQFGIGAEDRPLQERAILAAFKSRAQQYIQSPPDEKNDIEWLSLIQENGGPTRLLDFTESFYIATFFAVENTDQEACVWAVNRGLLNSRLQAWGFNKFVTDGRNSIYSTTLIELAEQVIFAKTKAPLLLVFPLMAPRLNERLAVRKGLFLLPCDLTATFENNLCASFKLRFDSLSADHAKELKASDMTEEHMPDAPVIKINLPEPIHNDAIRDLYSMNIDAASLFPGLEGFARSLKYLARIQEASTRRFASMPTVTRPLGSQFPKRFS
jgi:hypothetical protein